MVDETEAARRSALAGYGVLDSPNEAEFDRIVRDAAAALGTPIALISLIDDDRQWLKARVGLSAAETPRSISFCTHTIRGGEVMIVPDAREDERFSDNPLVTGDPDIRFYAGAPLTTPAGTRIGTICVLDDKPRDRLRPGDARKLERLAERTVQAMEDRRRDRAAAAARA